MDVHVRQDPVRTRPLRPRRRRVAVLRRFVGACGRARRVSRVVRAGTPSHSSRVPRVGRLSLRRGAGVARMPVLRAASAVRPLGARIARARPLAGHALVRAAEAVRLVRRTVHAHALPACRGRGALRLPRCRSCASLMWPPKIRCAACGSIEIDWVASSGRGVVHTFTVVRQGNDAYFTVKVPYVVAMIELDEGPRLMSNITGCDVEAVYIGMPVAVAFVDAGDGLVLPVFTPSDTTTR